MNGQRAEISIGTRVSLTNSQPLCYLPDPTHVLCFEVLGKSGPTRSLCTGVPKKRMSMCESRQRQAGHLFGFFQFISKMSYFQVKLTDGHLMWTLKTLSYLKLWKCNCLSCPIMTPTENFSFGYVVL